MTATPLDLLDRALASIRFDSGGRPARGQSPLVRILGRCQRVNECWEFQGHRLPKGYGQARYHGRMRHAHRIVFMELHDLELRRDQFVCHRCDNPPCCNPEHLFLGDAASNNLDRETKGRGGMNLVPGAAAAFLRARTHCKHGHEFTAGNTRRTDFPDGKFHRHCIACERINGQRRTAALRLARGESA